MKTRLLYIIDQLLQTPSKCQDGNLVFEETLLNIKKSILRRSDYVIVPESVDQMHTIVEEYHEKVKVGDITDAEYNYVLFVDEVLEVYYDLTDEKLTLLERGFSFML
jgi:hypothetical protein